MSGYIYFARTGHKEFDKVLELIEEAGEQYHNTALWNDSYNGEPSLIDKIDEQIELVRESITNQPNVIDKQ
jgi:hypothetical protein